MLNDILLATWLHSGDAGRGPVDWPLQLGPRTRVGPGTSLRSASSADILAGDFLRRSRILSRPHFCFFCFFFHSNTKNRKHTEKKTPQAPHQLNCSRMFYSTLSLKTKKSKKRKRNRSWTFRLVFTGFFLPGFRKSADGSGSLLVVTLFVFFCS